MKTAEYWFVQRNGGSVERAVKSVIEYTLLQKDGKRPSVETNANFILYYEADLSCASCLKPPADINAGSF